MTFPPASAGLCCFVLISMLALKSCFGKRVTVVEMLCDFTLKPLRQTSRSLHQGCKAATSLQNDSSSSLQRAGVAWFINISVWYFNPIPGSDCEVFDKYRTWTCGRCVLTVSLSVCPHPAVSFTGGLRSAGAAAKAERNTSEVSEDVLLTLRKPSTQSTVFSDRRCLYMNKKMRWTLSLCGFILLFLKLSHFNHLTTYLHIYCPYLLFQNVLKHCSTQTYTVVETKYIYSNFRYFSCVLYFYTAGTPLCLSTSCSYFMN